MTYLLAWTTTGTEVLVGLTDPADPARGMHVVQGRVEQDYRGRSVLRFTLPSSGEQQTVDAHRLASTSAALHVADGGDGWGVTVFPRGSEAHLRWLIREAQHGIRQLLGDRMVDTPQASRKLTDLAATLHSLVLRAALMSERIPHEAHPAA
jgi:hypothetical protein